MLRDFLDRHIETVITWILAIAMGGFVIWVLPRLGISYVEAGLVIVVFALSYGAVSLGEKLRSSAHGFLQLIGKLLIATGTVALLGFVVLMIGLVLWAKLTGPPTDCFRWCD